MGGGIFSEERCPVCGGSYVDNGKGLVCPKHKKQQASRFRVRIKIDGKLTQARFTSYHDASRFLNGIRFKIDEGSFDHRDYQSDNPMGFQVQAAKWLEIKRKQVKPRTWNNLNAYMQKAMSAWGNRNIKEIRYADIEDFLFHKTGSSGMGDLSNKTRSNARSALHDFWMWLVQRDELTLAQVPKFPVVQFELAYRKTIGLDTQSKIIEEVKRISHEANQRVWIGIKWLSTYLSIRPGELIQLKEGSIDIENGIFILHPDMVKEKKQKLVPMIEEDIELVRNLPRSFLELPFFRHFDGRSGATPGEPFGQRYLYKWWKKACANLGVDGVDLYAGTRHSTVIALGKSFTPEQLKQATMHSTNKAFERYFRVKPDSLREIYQSAVDERKKKENPIPRIGKSNRSIGGSNSHIGDPD
jgi:integrase